MALALVGSDLGAVAVLLATNPINLHSRDVNKRTPLSLVAENWHGKMIELLLSAGANPTSEDTKGLTTLNWAKIGNSRVIGLEREGK